MVRGQKIYIYELIRLLKVSNEGFGMKINLEKLFDKFNHKSVWLNGYDWQRTEKGDLSKHSDTPRDLNLDTKDVDYFFMVKLLRNLNIGEL